jgi:hypothetical protein
MRATSLRVTGRGVPTPAMRASTWGKLALGVLVIGGTFAVLWAIFRPSVTPTEPMSRPAAVPRLHDARATVRLWTPGSERVRRATIACDGSRRTASGFWAHTPAEACDALASTRGALLSGPGCRRLDTDRLRLRATGAFGSRRFDHRARRGGCPDIDAWLAVNALVAPVVPPDQELTEARRG